MKNPEVISATDKDGYYEMPFDDKYISIEILDGLDNSAGKIKKDKSVDYVVKKGKETLIPDNNSGKNIQFMQRICSSFQMKNKMVLVLKVLNFGIITKI